ncbi:MAG: type 4a pilus biogenesis protein PilO [Planctomycetota bacterium]
MARLSENQKLAVVGGVVVALCGLGGAGVWWAKGKVQEKHDAITGMKSEISDAESKIGKIPATEQEVIILRENLYEYVKILPEQQELNNFVRITEQFISQSGVTVTQLVPGREVKAGKSAFSRYTYKLELEATLWQFLQFMSLFESYERFIQVKEFALNSRSGRSATTEQDAVHTVSLTVETYVYTGSSKGRDVAIPNYPHKVEKLREEIFEARQTIATPGYKFQGSRGRRDIFVDPRESSLDRPRGHVGPSPKDQKKIIDRLGAKLGDCQDIYRRLQDKSITIFDRYSLERQLREQLGQLDREVEETNVKQYITHAPLKLTWTREVVEPLARLRREAAAVNEETDRWLPETEMRDLLAAIKDDLKSGEISTALERYDTVGVRMQVPKTDHRYAIRVAIEGLYLRAKLAEEFSGLRLDISGVCVNDTGKSGVILNGIVYQEGEYVDNNLLIKAVGRDRIEFVYKGFTVVKTL